MTDLSLVTFEDMWNELKKRVESGMYSGIVVSMVWRGDRSGAQRPSGENDVSSSFWYGGYHRALGLLADAQHKLLAGRIRDQEDPPDIDPDLLPGE